MQWDDDRISKELFNGVKYTSAVTNVDTFIPSFNAFFKKWAYFSSEDPQLISTQQWLMQQASERFHDFLITSHTDPKITAHLLKNPEMQECFYNLEAQRGMGVSWVSYFVLQALPKKEDMRNISFNLFKIHIDKGYQHQLSLPTAVQYANTMTDQQFDYILKHFEANPDVYVLQRMVELQFFSNEFEKIGAPERKKKMLETLSDTANMLHNKEPRLANDINQIVQKFNNELSKIKPAT
jgi:hypothetical protein